MAQVKPRLYFAAGHWFCSGYIGDTPAEAYHRWATCPSRFVPCGFVPRVHRRPA